MGKESYSWYVIKHKSNKYSAIIFDDVKKCRHFASKKGISYKGFSSKEEAIQYAGCKESKILFNRTEPKPPRICLACEKPFHGKTKLCPTCNKLRGNISVRNIVTIKSMYPEQNVFKTMQEKPRILNEIYRTMSSEERSAIRVEKGIEYRSDAYLKKKYQKTDTIIPDYIRTLFEKDETKEVLYLEGEKTNSKIFYKCKRCNQEQCQTYDSLKAGRGHNCEATKSSGEVIVEEYLKSLEIKFRMQRETLKCINPKTKMVMPYDFEIPNKKVIIEVQGNQHSSYTPYFHGSMENYEYQLWKDAYKKQFAEEKGYKVIELWYSDFETGKYKSIINKAIGI